MEALNEITCGSDVRAWRGRMGWSQSRAAAELCIIVPSLSNIESGRRNASGTVLRLAEILEHIASISKADPSKAIAPSMPIKADGRSASKPMDAFVESVIETAQELGYLVQGQAAIMLADAVRRIRSQRTAPQATDEQRIAARAKEAALEVSWRQLRGGPGLAELARLVDVAAD